jgi:hypothetical protein
MFGWFRKQRSGGDDLLFRLEERLIALIPKRVAALGIREPVYSLRIWYYGTDVPSDERVPSLMLPKEATRQSILSQRGPKAPHYLWCADELDTREQSYLGRIEDKELSALCRQWYDLERGSRPETEELRAIREMAQRVSARLNRIAWRSHAPVTDDFVVFPADGSHTFCADYEEMLASVPAERVDMLRARKLLGTGEWWTLSGVSEDE